LRPVFREVGHCAAFVYEALEQSGGRPQRSFDLTGTTGLSRRAADHPPISGRPPNRRARCQMSVRGGTRAPWAALRGRLRRPTGITESTRWLMAALVVVSVVLTVPAVLPVARSSVPDGVLACTCWPST